MTRVTAFGFPKKGNTASTWEELTGNASSSTGNEGAKAESSEMAIQREAGAGSGDKKRKRREDKVEEESGRTGGWGKNDDIKRKAERTEQRRVGRIENKNSSTICFACRQKGHAARECPNVLLAAQTPDAEGAGMEGSGAGPKKGMKRGKGQMGSDVTGAGGRCYRCDSTQHPLSKCPKPASVGLPFASCFICLQKGHLASKCPQNDRGVYPNGGSCKVCGKVDHRASDCPDDKRGKKPTEGDEGGDYHQELKALGDENGVVFGIGSGAGADEDDFMVVKRKRVELEKKVAEQRVVEKAQKLAKKIKEKRDFERQTREIAGETGGMTGNSEMEANKDLPARAKVAPPVEVSKPALAATDQTPVKQAAPRRPVAARVPPKKPKVVTF